MSPKRIKRHDPSTTSPPILVAVDATNLLVRAHHAHSTSQRRSPSGEPTWAHYGLARLVASAVDEITKVWRAPTGVTLCFDGPRDRCRRRNLDPTYKANRRHDNPDLEQQLLAAPQVFDDAGFHVVRIDGAEADDGCASAATIASDAGWRCVIVTSDRDAFAHVSTAVRVLRPVNGGGWDVIGPRQILDKYGVPQGRWAEYAALRGDKSDELPGVPRIGDKSAAAIVAALAEAGHSVVDVLNGVEGARAAVAPKYLKALDAGGANYHRNRLLMDAVCDLPIDLDVAKLRVDDRQVITACSIHGLGDTTAATMNRILPDLSAAA